MAKIYTRTGDSGATALFGGARVRKDHPRIEAIGAVDELNAAIALVRVELGRSGIAPHGVDPLLSRIQHQLFDMGAELALASGEQIQSGAIDDADVAALEKAIDQHDAQLPELRAFILPGGTPASAHLHVARCVCRRAERRLVELAAGKAVRVQLLRYLNRLSDLLFVLARFVNHTNRVPDVLWEGPASKDDQASVG